MKHLFQTVSSFYNLCHRRLRVKLVFAFGCAGRPAEKKYTVRIQATPQRPGGNLFRRGGRRNQDNRDWFPEPHLGETRKPGVHQQHSEPD